MNPQDEKLLAMFKAYGVDRFNISNTGLGKRRVDLLFGDGQEAQVEVFPYLTAMHGPEAAIEHVEQEIVRLRKGKGKRAEPEPVVPDLMEPLLGFRGWRVGPPPDYALMPYAAVRNPWRGNRWVQAQCNHGHHTAPHPGCHCGFNAWDTPRSPGSRVPFGGGDEMILGAVIAKGDVEVHRDGWRAEWVKPVVLGLPQGADLDDDMIPIVTGSMETKVVGDTTWVRYSTAPNEDAVENRVAKIVGLTKAAGRAHGLRVVRWDELVSESMVHGRLLGDDLRPDLPDDAFASARRVSKLGQLAQQFQGPGVYIKQINPPFSGGQASQHFSYQWPAWKQ